MTHYNRYHSLYKRNIIMLALQPRTLPWYVVSRHRHETSSTFSASQFVATVDFSELLHHRKGWGRNLLKPFITNMGCLQCMFTIYQLVIWISQPLSVFAEVLLVHFSEPSTSRPFSPPWNIRQAGHLRLSWKSPLGAVRWRWRSKGWFVGSLDVKQGMRILHTLW